jgi:hypothetical protein
VRARAVGRRLKGAVAGSLALLAAWCPVPGIAVEPSEKWGPFRGRLVDQATGQGIPGAAVIAVWWKNEPNPVQMNRSFFDAVEAVTDADGRFEIPRYPKPPFFDFLIYPAEVSYFAPGYQPVREEVTPPDRQIFVAPTVIFMKRLVTRQDLIRKRSSPPAGVPDEKMKGYTRAINVERAMLGLAPLQIPGEEKRP